MKIKKIASRLLAVLMLVSMLSVTAGADSKTWLVYQNYKAPSSANRYTHTVNLEANGNNKLNINCTRFIGQQLGVLVSYSATYKNEFNGRVYSAFSARRFTTSNPNTSNITYTNIPPHGTDVAITFKFDVNNTLQTVAAEGIAKTVS